MSGTCSLIVFESQRDNVYTCHVKNVDITPLWIGYLELQKWIWNKEHELVEVRKKW